MNEPTTPKPTPRTDEVVRPFHVYMESANLRERDALLAHARQLEHELQAQTFLAERNAHELELFRDRLAAEHAALETHNKCPECSGELWMDDASVLERKLAAAEYVGNLLAIIHGDGGHYRAEHGTVKATDDAIEIVCGLKRERDALQVEYESRAQWILSMNSILGYDNSDGFHSEPTPHELAKRLVREVAELKNLLRWLNSIDGMDWFSHCDYGTATLEAIAARAQLSAPAKERGGVSEMFAGRPTVRYRVWTKRKTDDDFSPTDSHYVYKEKAQGFVDANYPSGGFWEAEIRSEPYE